MTPPSCQCPNIETYCACEVGYLSPKSPAFIRDQSPSLKREIGEALRDLQKGINIGLPLSRPMPSIASGAHELRMRTATATVRVFYFVKLADTILVFHGFQKKTQKTPAHEIALGQQRLQEMVDDNE